MLIQLPSGSSDQQGPRGGEASNAFEAGLRRDLASAPIVSYDSMLGGGPKRAVDLTLALVTIPLWAPMMLIAAGISKLRHPAPVFQTRERIGYGGRAFKCFKLRISPPTDNVVRLGEAGAVSDLAAIAGHAQTRRAKWRSVLERLPQMFNVIAGDMALVGPSPLSRQQLEPLKTARRYYLSARPGIVGVRALASGDDEGASQFKTYAMSWSFGADALIFWDALNSLRNRGELWKPSFKRLKAGDASAVVVRRRGGAR